MNDKYTPPFKVVAKEKDGEEAARIAEKMLNACWDDPDWRDAYLEEFRKRFREALEKGEV